MLNVLKKKGLLRKFMINQTMIQYDYYYNSKIMDIKGETGVI